MLIVAHSFCFYYMGLHSLAHGTVHFPICSMLWYDEKGKESMWTIRKFSNESFYTLCLYEQMDGFWWVTWSEATCFRCTNISGFSLSFYLSQSIFLSISDPLLAHTDIDRKRETLSLARHMDVNTNRHVITMLVSTKTRIHTNKSVSNKNNGKNRMLIFICCI